MIEEWKLTFQNNARCTKTECDLTTKFDDFHRY